MTSTFDATNFLSLCDALAERDPHLNKVLEAYGYPPLWSRPLLFSTLVHIILEQQVSLASAMAAFLKLREKCGTVTPEKIMELSDEALRSCYFSRQKTGYVRSLAEAFLSGKIDLPALALQPDLVVKATLQQVKGIGEWTSDVFLIFALHRADVFPAGDLAVINAFRLLYELPAGTPREEIARTAAGWAPYRSVGAMLLWHFYIKKKNLVIAPAMFSAVVIPSPPAS